MARLNVYLPDELAESVSERLAGVNVSAVLQERLRELLGCDHRTGASCVECGEPIDVHEHSRAEMGRLYLDLLDAFRPLVIRGATAEGAARAAKTVAERWQVPTASTPLPRPTRAERRKAKVRDLPELRPVPRPAQPAPTPAQEATA